MNWTPPYGICCHFPPEISESHWAKEVFYIRQCQDAGDFLNSVFYSGYHARHSDGINIVAIFRVRPKPHVRQHYLDVEKICNLCATT